MMYLGGRGSRAGYYHLQDSALLSALLLMLLLSRVAKAIMDLATLWGLLGLA